MIKNYFKLFIIVLISLVYSNESKATHIIGGALTYEHLGGSSYKVSLRLYRDCGPGSATLGNSVVIEVLRGDGTDPGLDFTMPRLDLLQLDPPIDTCAFNPGVCVEEATYSKIVSLPPSATGYHIFHQTWARNGSLQNIVDPLNAGESFNSYIPNIATLLTNSSPIWTNFPPVFVCRGQDLDFDHSATDPDGDSLSYSFYTPYTGRPVGQAQHFNAAYYPAVNGAGTPPDNITFPTVVYSGGFSTNSPLNDPGPALSIDPVTGLINGIPQNTGQFVVGIKVEEWRNGQKIGVIVRDFQFNVLNCPPAKDAGIQPITACAGNTVDLLNGSSAGANGFEWDFDDGSPVSNDVNPTHTFPGIGDYDIRLIAQAGTPCADTAFYLLKVSDATSDFTSTAPNCEDQNINFNDNSSSAVNGTINSWTWDFDDGSSSTVPNPSHTFTDGGIYDVSLAIETDAGCKDTLVVSVNIQSLPDVNVGPDTTACKNNPLININAQVNGAAGGLWVGAGGTFNPGNGFLNVTYDPSAAEILAGSSQLILSTTGNGLCPSQNDTIVITYIDGPTLDAGSAISVCKDTSEIPLNATAINYNGLLWTTSGTGTFTDNDSIVTSYEPSSIDTANGSVTLYLESTNNGFCVAALDSVLISFFNPPTVDITSADTICAGEPIDLNANSSSGIGYWETLGDGFFMPNDTGNVIVYEHGTNDEGAGGATVIFHSLNNGGCRSVLDTFTFAIIPSPEADFIFDSVCNGVNTQFNDLSASVEPINNWEWDFNSEGNSTQQNPSFTFANAGENNTTLVVTSANNCTDTISKSITVHFNPIAGFEAPIPCLEGGTQYIDTTSIDSSTIVTWVWSFGDNNGSTEQNPIHQYNAAGVYDVNLIVISAYGCSDTITTATDIYPGPNAAFTVNPTSAYLDQDINFTDISESDYPIIEWYWDFGDNKGTDDLMNPVYSYQDKGEFNPIMIIVDEHGCIDTATNEVFIFLPPQVPNGFSPNGDGSNDVLSVLGGPYSQLTFKIYNSWGEIIFQSDNQFYGWDGKFKGKEQPMGVYAYTVEAITIDGETYTLKGDVTLLR